MREIGIALGEKEAGVVIVEERKITFSKRYVFGKEEMENMEVMINKLRRILNIKREDQVYLALPEKKIILRSFKLPLMGKKELEGGIPFEIEKYIPFEINELIWDYAYTRIPNEKKIIISFLAIKKEEFRQFREIFATVDVNLSLIEPGFFSLFRIIKSKKEYSKYKEIGMLELTSSQGSFTIFFKNLPLFNHTFLIKDSSTPDFLKEKIREELRFSLQYFRREFSEFSLEKLIVIAKEDIFQEKDFFLSLKEELEVSIEIEMISINNLVKLEEDLNVLRAYGVVEFNYLPVRFPSLYRKVESFLCRKKEKKEVVYLPFVVEVILGFFFLIGLNIFFQIKINNLEKKIKEKRKELSLLPLKDKSRKFVEYEIEKRKKAIEELTHNNELEDTLFIFKSIEKTLPEGMWLKDLKIDFERKKGFISGYVYLDNSYKEKKAVDEFVKRLNGNEKIKSFFSLININTKRRELLKEFLVTYFEISLGKEDEK